jgi:hypothetical protein
MDQNSFTIIDLAAILYVVFTVVGLLIVYSILKRLLRKIGEVWSRGSLFGSDQKTRLISLGIAALLFPSVFYSIGSAIIYFISSFFVYLPQGLFTNWQTNQSFCANDPSAIRLCLGQLGNGFVQAWTSALADALNLFGPNYISYSRLILMLAVWAGVALFLSADSKKDKQDGSEPKVRLQDAFDRLSDATRQNIMFFLILVLAGYLSIAAIAAIPGLEETAVPSEAVSVERLQEQLDEAFKQSQARIPEQIQLSKPLATPTRPVTTPNGAEEALTSFNTALNDYYSKVLREEWSGLYSNLREDVATQTESSKSAAISAYRASVIDRKGTKETVQHFLDIDAWFRQELNGMEARVADCRRRIANADGLINSYASQSQDPSWIETMNQILSQSDKDIREACQLIGVSAPVPGRRDLGSNMGPFSYIASWLLRTESLPLAQIVGLLGFGLLGSAVSSLVRNSAQRPKNTPLVEELATVIIRGATAAVVVFLAVKGGLAIFTSGESNPNSYVLLLTCLIAAVFSEDVWAEAHKRLNKELSGDEITLPAEVVPPPEPPLPAEIPTDSPSPEETHKDDSDQMLPAA